MGNVKLIQKQWQQEILWGKKIPNLKHQISITNDQNIYQVYAASFHKPNLIEHFRCCVHQQSDHIFWDFEFGLLEFVWDLFFGAWNFYNLHKTGNLL